MQKRSEILTTSHKLLPFWTVRPKLSGQFLSCHGFLAKILSVVSFVCFAFCSDWSTKFTCHAAGTMNCLRIQNDCDQIVAACMAAETTNSWFTSFQDPCKPKVVIDRLNENIVLPTPAFIPNCVYSARIGRNWVKMAAKVRSPKEENHSAHPDWSEYLETFCSMTGILSSWWFFTTKKKRKENGIDSIKQIRGAISRP